MPACAWAVKNVRGVHVVVYRHVTTPDDFCVDCAVAQAFTLGFEECALVRLDEAMCAFYLDETSLAVILLGIHEYFCDGSWARKKSQCLRSVFYLFVSDSFHVNPVIIGVNLDQKII